MIVEIYRWLSPIKESLLVTFCGFVSHCCHQPTCSQYLLEQAKINGWKGLKRGLKRIFTCWRC
ncbi:membrane protein insertion efficiency factor YidD [bacterium]|nr:membrane protein insertion efficiency factor YidD [bacterium]